MYKIFFLSIFLFLIQQNAFAQVNMNLSSKYLHSSEYSNEEDTHTGTVKSLLLEGNASMPFYKNISPTGDKVRMWTGFVNAKYLKMYESRTPQPYFIDEILNMNAGVSYYRNLKKKWYLSVSAGFGIHTPGTRFSDLTWKDNIMVFASGMAIYKINQNLEVGVGLVFTNAFYTPIVMPSTYAQWKGDGKFHFLLSSNSNNIVTSAGMRVKPWLDLSLLFEYNTISTPLPGDESGRYYYSYMYMTTGLRPEFRVSSWLTIPIEAGIAMGGAGNYQKRKLSSLFKTQAKYSFDVCPYVSVGLRLNLFNPKKK